MPSWFSVLAILHDAYKHWFRLYKLRFHLHTHISLRPVCAAAIEASRALERRFAEVAEERSGLAAALQAVQGRADVLEEELTHLTGEQIAASYTEPGREFLKKRRVLCICGVLLQTFYRTASWLGEVMFIACACRLWCCRPAEPQPANPVPRQN
jgi:hypothetical protein